MLADSLPSAVFIADGVAISLVRPRGRQHAAKPAAEPTGQAARWLNLRPGRLHALRSSTAS